MDGSRRLMLTPPLSVAQPDLAARLDAFSIVSPIVGPIVGSYDKEAAASTMPSPPLQERSFFAQNRAILLSGLPPSPRPSSSSWSEPAGGGGQGFSPATTPQTMSTSTTTNSTTNNSRSPRKPPNRRLTPLITRGSAGSRQFLAASSLSPMMSPRVISPCVYVRAAGLERQNAVSPRAVSESSDGDGTGAGAGAGADTTADGSEPPLLKDGQLYICAIVRPSSDEKPYAIRRVVDRHALARAVPKPDDAQTAASVNILPSPVLHSPLSAMPSLNTSIKRRASPSPLSPASPHPSLRRHSRQSSQNELPSPAQFTAAGGVPIPIRTFPSLCLSLPLSAFLCSSDTALQVPIPPLVFSPAWLPSFCRATFTPATRSSSRFPIPKPGPKPSRTHIGHAEKSQRPSGRISSIWAAPSSEGLRRASLWKS